MCASLAEEWKVMGQCDRTKGGQAQCSKWGETAQGLFTQIQIPVGVLLLGDKEVPFLRVLGGHFSPEGRMTSFRGRSESPSCIYFLKLLQLEISNMPRH